MSVIQAFFARLRNAMTARYASDDAAFDPYENTPMRREDLERLFEMDGTQQPEVDEAPLRDSERLERDTMNMIRGALYAE